MTHGTLHGYQNLGCRCWPCRVAHAAYYRQRYAEWKARSGWCPHCRRPWRGATVNCARCQARLRAWKQRARLAQKAT